VSTGWEVINVPALYVGLPNRMHTLVKTQNVFFRNTILELGEGQGWLNGTQRAITVNKN
jgi:hypothetical protein